MTTAQKPSLSPVDHKTDWQAYEQRRDQRAKEYEAKRPELLKCLDPEYAAEAEARKPVYKYDIEATVMKQDKRGRRYHETFRETVSAQTEDDAWAKFCDTIRHWPSPRHCDRKIRKHTKKA